MKEVQEIKTLIGLWEAGESTTEQEKQLNEYFRGNTVPEELAHYRVLFNGLATFSAEAAEEMEKHSSELRVDFGIDRISFRRRAMRWGAAVSSAAAAVAVILSLALSKPYCYVNGEPVRDIDTAIEAAGFLSMLDSMDDMPQGLELLKNLNIDE